ncbi:MAG: hypothetical protein K2H76_11050, partial [Muribaculaceae bacterium]|nr:hypothetical protein [Muribaculaceae bacterium]
DILYSHFHRKAHRSETLTLMEIEQRKIVEDLARQRKEISAALKDAEGKLKEIQDARVDDAILPDLK